LLSEFGAWLKSSYNWMEKTLEDKRAALEEELPAEKERIDSLLEELTRDLQRRIREQLWAMQETRDKRNEKERDAARLERIKGKKQQAQKKKQQVEEMDEELQVMQLEYEKLKALLDKVSKRSANTVPRNSGAIEWVSSFFYNNDPPEKRYSPPALNDKESVSHYLADSTASYEVHRSERSSDNSWWKRSGLNRIADYVVPGRKRKHSKSSPDENDSQYLGNKRRAIGQPHMQVSHSSQASQQFYEAPRSRYQQRAITWKQ